MQSWFPRALTSAAALAVCAAPALVVPVATAAVQAGSPVVINEVYGGGGNSGATYTHDFVELYNAGTTAVDLTGWTLQYAGSAGTSWSGSTALTGTLQPGDHYLVQQARGTGGTTALPTPDVVGTIAMGGSDGNVALVSSATRLTCVATACAADPAVVDLVGYGSGAAYAGTGAAPRLSATTSASRDARSTNTADNRADFTAGALTPGAATAGPVAPVALTIPQVQGTGDASPVVGATAVVQGVVTAAYPTGGLFGFVIQTPGSGGTAPTEGTASQGLFVYQRSGAVGVQVGDLVEVTGTVAEFAGLTQLVVPDASGVTVLPGDAAAPVPVTGTPWPRTAAERERLESMLFLPSGEYTVTNTYSTNQYGEVGLAFGDGPLVQPTDVARPGTPAYDAVVADNAARAVTLDDGSTVDFLRTTNGDLTPPYLSVTDPVRVGAQVTFPEALVVDFRNGAWKLQPTTPVTDTTPATERPTFEDTREGAPDASRLGDGEYTVASFNVLNYFTTLGTDDPACVAYTDPDGEGVTVRTGCDQRGAWDAEDLARQQAKIVDAITTLDASVVGLMEIENSLVVDGVADEALATLVAALNAEAGEQRWAYVPSSTELPDPAEMDVITNAIIYQPAEVTPLGEMRVLGEQSGAGEVFDNAREPIAQAFQPGKRGEPFLVVVNHFKSKGSGSGPNADQGDGQGASNLDRVEQATALRDWVPTLLDDYVLPVQDTFLVGDFNAYTEEDPLQVLYAAGFEDANRWMESRGVDRDYSYSFSGLSGSLDHVLVSSSVLDRLTGADIWEINAPESVALEYSRYGYHGTSFYEEGPFRSSDHDPVVVAFTEGEKQHPVPDRPGQGSDHRATPAVPNGPGEPATPAVPAPRPDRP